MRATYDLGRKLSLKKLSAQSLALEAYLESTRRRLEASAFLVRRTGGDRPSRGVATGRGARFSLFSFTGQHPFLPPFFPPPPRRASRRLGRVVAGLRPRLCPAHRGPGHALRRVERRVRRMACRALVGRVGGRAGQRARGCQG